MSEHKVSSPVSNELSSLLNTCCGDFIFGDGVFTTLKFSQKQPIHLDVHLRRLRNDANRIAIEAPEPLQILNQINQSIKDFAQSEGILRIALVRSRVRSMHTKLSDEESILLNDDAQVIINCRHLSDWPEQINAFVCRQRLSRNPALAGIKHLSRLDLMLATREFRQLRQLRQLRQHKADIQEGIVLDTENFVIEGLISNIFWYKQEKFYTPQVNFAGVNGLTRQRIIEKLKQHKFAVNIGEFTLQDLLSSEHVWLCNSVRGIKSVSRIDMHQLTINQSLNILLQEALDDDD